MKLSFRFTAAALSMMLFLSSCTPHSVTTQQSRLPSSPDVSSSEPSEPNSPERLPQVGDQISGFTATARGKIDSLGAETVTFIHEKSGAQLYLIQNDDPELAFSIAYRTVCLDESDVNHVFEHSILQSSEKYPSKSLFMELGSNAYVTNANATTKTAATCYEVSSLSEEQLYKAMDVYLNCMVAPGILTDQNFFKREALRYKLPDRDSPITIAGTVFSEDSGFLSSSVMESGNNVADTLYPNLAASNLLGRVEHNYRNLTYEKLLETYERYYSFDNSLIVLYGNLDCGRALAFLDTEYLSKAENRHTDLSAYFNEPVPEGHVEAEIPSPAYEGDSVENASVLNYSVDLSAMPPEETYAYEWFATLLNGDGSPLEEALQEAGIEGTLECSTSRELIKPYFDICLTGSDPAQKQEFRQTAREVLETISQQGLPEEFYNYFLEKIGLMLNLSRNETGIGNEYARSIAQQWAIYGAPDYYEQWEQAFEELRADPQQKKIREMAGWLAGAAHTALVATVPTPGLAEQIEQERAEDLAQMKASMSEEELDKLIVDTQAFNEWNTVPEANPTYAIPISQLPDPIAPPPVEKTEHDGAVIYSAPASLGDVGDYRLWFNAEGSTREECFLLKLYCELLPLFADSELLPVNLSFETQFFPDQQQDALRPYIGVEWLGSPSEFNQSLQAILSAITTTTFEGGDMLPLLLRQIAPSYDISALGSALEYASKSRELAIDGLDGTDPFGEQDFFRYLQETISRLEEDPDFAEALLQELNGLGPKLCQRGGMLVSIAAREEALEELVADTKKQVENLPLNPPSGELLPSSGKAGKKIGIVVETSMQSHVLVLGTKNGALPGKYMPFLTLAGDRYLNLARFQNGAYSAPIAYKPYGDVFIEGIVVDPLVSESIEMLYGVPDYLAQGDFSQEELTPYILAVYAQATAPKGTLDQAVNAIRDVLMGIDSQKRLEQISDIKNASAEELDDAVAAIRRQNENGVLVSMGNGQQLEANRDLYDEFLDYRK